MLVQVLRSLQHLPDMLGSMSVSQQLVRLQRRSLIEMTIEGRTICQVLRLRRCRIVRSLAVISISCAVEREHTAVLCPRSVLIDRLASQNSLKMPLNVAASQLVALSLVEHACQIRKQELYHAFSSLQSTIHVSQLSGAMAQKPSCADGACGATLRRLVAQQPSPSLPFCGALMAVQVIRAPLCRLKNGGFKMIDPR